VQLADQTTGRSGVEAPARTTVPSVDAADRRHAGLNANDDWRIAHDQGATTRRRSSGPVKESVSTEYYTEVVHSIIVILLCKMDKLH